MLQCAIPQVKKRREEKEREMQEMEEEKERLQREKEDEVFKVSANTNGVPLMRAPCLKYTS